MHQAHYAALGRTVGDSINLPVETDLTRSEHDSSVTGADRVRPDRFREIGCPAKMNVDKRIVVGTVSFSKPQKLLIPSVDYKNIHFAPSPHRRRDPFSCLGGHGDV